MKLYFEDLYADEEADALYADETMGALAGSETADAETADEDAVTLCTDETVEIFNADGGKTRATSGIFSLDDFVDALAAGDADLADDDEELLVVGDTDRADLIDQTGEPEEASPVDTMALAGALVTKIDQNPALRIPAYTVLAACADGRRELEELYAEVAEALEAKRALPVQPVSAVVDMLVRGAALASIIEVDGKPYEGSEADLIADDDVPEDAQVLTYASITEVGRIVAGSCSPRQRAVNLFEDMPQFGDAFVRTLELCDTDDGLKAKELERKLDAEGYLYRDYRDLPTVYPSMYANFLKDIEALRWDHAWITTPLGREVAAARRASCPAHVG
mgnify:CR=1 FL=1